jgi:nucleoside permease NupC
MAFIFQGWCGALVGIPQLTFQYILGKIFIPLSGIMGVEAKVSSNRTQTSSMISATRIKI